MNFMLPVVLRTFVAAYQLDITRPLVLGVSGGVDSLALLDAASEARWPALVAHFNHRLRPEADEEAEMVRRLARDYGYLCEVGAQDVRSLAEAQRLSLEEAARQARYRYLFALAESRGASAVVVAHHADDQVETVLMHLLRGAGPEGLRGMSAFQVPNPWSERIALARPFLTVWRAEILAYARRRGLRWVEDVSNRDMTFFRNRLRHELLPLLETYNPRVRERLLKTAEVLRAENEILEDLTGAHYPQVEDLRGEGFVGLSTERLCTFPEALQRRLLRAALHEVCPDCRDWSFDAVERALSVARGGRQGSEIAAGVRVAREAGRLFVYRVGAALPDAHWPLLPVGVETLELPVPGQLRLHGDWILRAEVVAKPPRSVEAPDRYSAWVGFPRPVDRLQVRVRRPGDRFVPLGMPQGTVKISDLMVNEKIPARVRGRWPLVCHHHTIVWVPGCRQAHDFRVQSDTPFILLLRVEKAS